MTLQVLSRAALNSGAHHATAVHASPGGKAAAAILVQSHQAGPDLLGWIRMHLLNPYAITAAATVLLLFIPFIIRALDQRDRPDREQPTARDRTVILQRVRNRWITSALESSPASSNHLDLGLHRRPDVVGRHQQATRNSNRFARIQTGKTVLEIFDEVASGLLIIGAPGSGKTTLLLELAKGLLDRADASREAPIPVIANLSSWGNRQQPLAAWLIEEVAVRQYKVQSMAFTYWLAKNKIVLLLDGLDEVGERRRDACIEAINAFREEHGLTAIAVSCLTEEAEKIAGRLELEEAIELDPATDMQVSSYLRSAEAAGTPTDDIRTAIAADQELRNLLRTPLMLYVATAACHGLPGAALQDPGSREVRLNRLWDEYVQSMFQRRPAEPHSKYDREIFWLEWLASALQERSEMEFYLDRLTIEWLPSKTRRQWRFIGPLYRALAEYIRPVEGLHWSLDKALPRFFTWRASTEIASFSVTMMVGYIAILATVGFGVVFTGQRGAFILSGTVLGLCCVAIALISLGWTTELKDARSTPNEAIQRSAKSGLFVGLPAGALFGLVFGLADEHIFMLGNAIIFGVGVGLFIGLFVGLVFGFGACLAHYLVRVLLVLYGVTPWRYHQFLETMTDRQLMRRSGGCYVFAHRLLRDHLADQMQRHAHLGDGTTVR